MDNFIYVIALVAWAAFALYRKSQKKAEAARKEQQRPQSREIISPFPSMKDIFGEASYGEVLTFPGAPAVVTDGMAPQLQETEFAEEYKKRGISSVEELDPPSWMRDHEVAEIQDDELSEGDEFKIACRQGFNVRQAVIYSAILNRPYV